MASDSEKLAHRMAEAEDEELRLLVTTSTSAAQRAGAARELVRRGRAVPDAPALPEVPASTLREAHAAELAKVLDPDAARSTDSVSRLRLVAVGVKLGAIASVFSVFVLPSSIGSWPIVLTGATLGGLVAFFLTRPR